MAPASNPPRLAPPRFWFVGHKLWSEIQPPPATASTAHPPHPVPRPHEGTPCKTDGSPRRGRLALGAYHALSCMRFFMDAPVLLGLPLTSPLYTLKRDLGEPHAGHLYDPGTAFHSLGPS